MALYGFNAYQVYIYFSTLQGEHYLKRSSVALLAMLDAASVGLLTQAVHTYMVLEFPKSSPAVESPTTIFAVDNGLAVLMILIVQLSYAQRIRRYNTAVAAFVGVISITAFALGIVMTVKMAQLEDFDFMAKESMKAITGACQGLTLSAGLVTTGMMYLHHDPTKSTSLDESFTMPYDNLVDLVWERGVAGTVIQFAYFVVFLSSPSDRFWMPFQLTARRAFMLGLVTLYINRGIAQGREVSDSADTTPVSTNAFRARKGDLSTTTEFSTLGDTASENNETATKNNAENIFRIDVTKTIEHDPPFGDYKKPLETQDSE
ncbi:hypothetical protein EDD18DRAFT_1150569 [Armillaria luteobubalina]|uniref:Uncharacterized protein n=1 Tax=Armillaria luteobubalina TaxID=153913 RepID=A0AA39QAI6_9AGAR|nr:hypothetical protein EDD18DRAFT_1150569 [Armillaria luteobubalina]